MIGRLYYLVYHLDRHRLLGWTLTRWLVYGAIFGPIFFYLSPFRRLAWGWGLLAGLIIISLIGLLALWQIRRGDYLQFDPQTTPIDIAAKPLSFPEKISLRASGYFRVNNQQRYFVEESAYYQTFNTRERVIMVEVARTRFLWLAQSTELDVGWWYTFFTADLVHQVDLGRLSFGPHLRPALRLRYQPAEASDPETLYISFESEAACRKILADLQAG